MTSPLLYDFIRTMKSKPTILIILGLSLLTAAWVPALTAESGGFNPGLTGAGVYYRESDGFHFLIFSANSFSQPLSGVNYTVVIKNPTQNYVGQAISNSSGYASLVINAPPSEQALGAVTVQVDGYSAKSVFPLPGLPMGQVVPLRLPDPMAASPFYVSTDPSNSNKRTLNVFYAGTDGTRPSFPAYFTLTNASGIQPGGPGSLNETQMQFLGRLNDYHQTFPLTLSTGQICTTRTPPCDTNLFFGIFSDNGSLLVSDTVPEIAMYPPPPALVSSNSFASHFFIQILGLVVPLIGIVGSFTSYGKDRVSGLLESVLARPVSRRGLAISRYLTTLLALSVAVVASVSIVDVLLYWLNGSFIDTVLITGTTISFLVEIASLIGIVFLLSQFVKSTNMLMAASVGLYVGLVLVGTLIALPITTLMGGTPDSAVYLQVTVISYLANPAQYAAAMNIYLTNTILAFGYLVQPLQYGLTILTLAISAISWTAVPLLLLLRVVTKRD